MVYFEYIILHSVFVPAPVPLRGEKGALRLLRFSNLNTSFLLTLFFRTLISSVNSADSGWVICQLLPGKADRREPGHPPQTQSPSCDRCL